jgi:hypothetical protein
VDGVRHRGHQSRHALLHPRPLRLRPRFQWRSNSPRASFWARLSPSMNLMLMKGCPSTLPISKTDTMFGCSNRAAASLRSQSGAAREANSPVNPATS